MLLDSEIRRLDPRRRYTEGRERESRLADEARRASERLTAVRGLVFLGLLGCLVLADPLEGAGEPLALVLAAALLTVFLVLVRRHRRVRRRRETHETLARLHATGLARLDRDWDALDGFDVPEGPGGSPPDEHPYAPDLYLFGHASLFRLVGPPTTVLGKVMLAGWLRAPAPPEEVARRQDAVRALAPAADLRHRLTLLGLEGPAERMAHVPALVEWAKEPPWLESERAVRAAAVLLPPLSITLLVLYFTTTLAPYWVVPFVLQVVALLRVRKRIAADVARIGVGAPAARRYAGQLELLTELPQSSLLDEIRGEITGSGVPADQALDSLGARLDFAESRSNLVYQALNYAVLLDVWVYRSLERWKVAHGEAVAGWLDALGRAEALAGLATLAHDHPGWCFPEVLHPPDEGPTTPRPSTPKSAGDGDDGMSGSAGPRLAARELGHPLLPDRDRVTNDVEIGPPGTFLLVTGSNMSGKSTLLRAVGANAVLAQAGGPACAESMSLPSVSVWTSMMIGDSLEGGVSRFMAELLRLKAVVDAARAVGPDDPPVLYLLDEILQGTNTAERRVAARTALRHLLEAGAIGAVTSHDLTLHRAPDLERRARAWHFRETVERVKGRPRLHFDYRLRPGLATTTNALELLEAVGLGPVEEPAEEGIEEGDAL